MTGRAVSGRARRLLARLAIGLAARPRRKPMKTCGSCQRTNEPDRTSCWYCGKAF